MRILLSIIVSAWMASLNAQGWTFFPEADTLFFGANPNPTNSNYEIAEYVLGAEAAYDSNGIQVQKLRSTWIPCTGCGTGLRGEIFIENQYPWLGSQLLTYPDGHIEGGLGTDAWVFYPYNETTNPWLYRSSNMDSMRLISRYAAQIYGNLDSVKLFVSNAGDSIRVAKNHGIISFKIQSEHHFYYQYLGSQKLRDHLYIPTFFEFYRLKENEWFLFQTRWWEGNENIIIDNKDFQVINKNVSIQMDEIIVSRITYKKSYYYKKATRSHVPGFEETKKEFYRDTVRYSKLKYEELCNPFTKPGAYPPSPSYYALQWQGNEIVYPCLEKNGNNGFGYSNRHQSGNGDRLNGNRFFRTPNLSFGGRYEVTFADGHTDFMEISGGEHSNSEKLIGFYSLNDTLPDTLNYFPLSVSEIAQARIYPNPFSNSLHIEGSQVYDSYTLYDLRGIKISAGTITNQSIHFEALETGIFILELSSSQGNGMTSRIRVMKH